MEITLWYLESPLYFLENTCSASRSGNLKLCPYRCSDLKYCKCKLLKHLRNNHVTSDRIFQNPPKESSSSRWLVDPLAVFAEVLENYLN